MINFTRKNITHHVSFNYLMKIIMIYENFLSFVKKYSFKFKWVTLRKFINWNIILQGLAKKFIGWLKYLSCNVTKCSFIFRYSPQYLSIHFFHLFYSVWIPLIKKVINSRYDIIIWTFQKNYSIDYILLIYPWNYDLIKITDRLNNILPTIDFIYELKTNNTLLFEDILLINHNNKLEFKVHLKSTNKIFHIHFTRIIIPK